MLWKRNTRVANDKELASLMELAAVALKEEDRRLAKAIDAGRKTRHRTLTEVGSGLSYWVYETTLVYLIWRAWIENGKLAAWDWTASGLAADRSSIRGRGGLRFDLVAFADKPTSVFEAKWWNVETTAMRDALVADASKLRGSLVLGGAKKYLLVFWHEEAGADASSVQKLCHDEQLTYCGDARFPARFRAKNADVDGDFVMAALRVNTPK
ncbi:MAG: hypothetical protein H0U00_08095 [Actinobacteria bacterium]|nr:hypothetical protein [Actinomycetota bacterium]